MKRKDDISIEEFRRFWNSAELNDLIDRMISHALTAGVKKNLTLDIDVNKALQAERGAKQPFDGVFEVLWQSGGDLPTLLANPEFQQLTQEMEEVQRRFVDFHESRRFFTEYIEDSNPL
jgi:hypothetical protein